VGDAVLKYQATLHCFRAYPQAHEGTPPPGPPPQSPFLVKNGSGMPFRPPLYPGTHFPETFKHGVALPLLQIATENLK